jgi:hypothetical protein
MEQFISTFLPDLFKDIYGEEQISKFGYEYYGESLDGQYFFTHGGCYVLAKIVKYFVPESIIMIRNDYDHCAISFRDELYDGYGKIMEEERINYNIASKKDIDFFEAGGFSHQYVNYLYNLPIADVVIKYIIENCRIDGLIKEINAPVEEIVGQKK